MSCNTEEIFFEEYSEVPDNAWPIDQSPHFKFTIEDTLQRYDMSFNLRYTSAYEWENIWVFIDVEFPNKMINRDTLQFLLQDGLGHWLGTGSADLYDYSSLFKKDVRFPQAGEYKVTIHQAMRSDPLEDISDVGLKLQKSSK